MIFTQRPPWRTERRITSRQHPGHRINPVEVLFAHTEEKSARAAEILFKDVADLFTRRSAAADVGDCSA